ncbi:MAG: anhydro-N-acetylmuramic acid kinase [Ferruginibacter sp.]
MNSSIQKIYQLAGKTERLIIGLMSGTSLDGLDVALCRFKGSGSSTEVEVLNFETVSFNENFKKEVRSVFSKEMVNLEKLTLLNPWIALQHANIVNSLLRKWNIKNADVDLIASHGQSIYHAPKSLHQQDQFGNATLQIGDGDHLAMATGIITLSDFRQKHIAAGGEGAPLALYADYFLFSNENENRILLNIGGIANFTFLPEKNNPTKVMCTDVGPGNTMMDAYMQEQFPGKYFDKDSVIAKQGTVNNELLTELKRHPFFEQSFPKTTGPELFNLGYLQRAKEKSDTHSIPVYDTMATLNRFTADIIVSGIKKNIPVEGPIKIFSSGGGIHNSLLMQQIKAQLPAAAFYTTAELKIDPDAKEAVLFAVLANECVCGNNTIYPEGLIKVSMGKISLPE